MGTMIAWEEALGATGQWGSGVGSTLGSWHSCADAMIVGHPVFGSALTTLCGQPPFGVDTWKEMLLRSPTTLSSELWHVRFCCRCF